jgi:hypothetical protein
MGQGTKASSRYHRRKKADKYTQELFPNLYGTDEWNNSTPDHRKWLEKKQRGSEYQLDINGEKTDLLNVKSGDPDKMAAAITRGEFAEYESRFKPVELAALEESKRTDFKVEGDRASANMRRQGEISHGSMVRGLRGRGVKINQEQREGMARRSGISNTLGEASAENTTRRGLKEGHTNDLAKMVSMGRDIAGGASSGLNTASNLQTRRQNQNAASDAANEAAGIQTAGMIAALAFMV